MFKIILLYTQGYEHIYMKICKVQTTSIAIGQLNSCQLSLTKSL